MKKITFDKLIELSKTYENMSIRIRNIVSEGIGAPEWIQLPLIFVTKDTVLSCTVKVGDPSSNEIKEVAPFLEIIEGKEYDYGYGNYQDFRSLKQQYGELDLTEFYNK